MTYSAPATSRKPCKQRYLIWRAYSFEAFGTAGPSESGVGFLNFEDNDLAVEWCENRLFGESWNASKTTHSLASYALFSGIPDNLLTKLENLVRIQKLSQGDKILLSGQEGDGRIFFIESGRASILLPLQNGKHQRISSLGSGMSFGELALLGQNNRSASVYAETEIKCLVIDSSAILALCEQTPSLKVALLENLSSDLADRLRHANHWVSILA